MNNIWWTRVPNARTLADRVSEDILSEQNLLLKHKLSLPWNEDFLEIITEKVVENSSSKSFDAINGVSSPGDFLLREYCKAEKRASFRPSIGYPKFFAESDDIVIHRKFFWVNLKNDDEIKSWIDFVKEYRSYRGKGKEQAVFVLDCTGEHLIQKPKGIKVIDTDEFINEYDKKIYATLISGQLDEPTWLKSYLAELMCEIAGFDCELMDLIIEDYNEFLLNPYQALNEQLAMRPEYCDAIIDEKIAENSVWKAQIKIIYPLIEEYRKSFVEKHFTDIARNLPLEMGSGETFYQPQDVELGGLIYMMGTTDFRLSEREYSRLEAFKDARNVLSHLGILSWPEIEELMR